ncbi:MAG: glycosyltransferase, partial [Capsulimonadales bacterium]|nr:glycosyltransferase [Capsulimonadales bacterium]
MTDKPLNILQVGSGFPGWGGTELHLVNLAQQLAQRGHYVTVAARPGKFVEEEARKRNLRTLPFTVNRQWDFKESQEMYRLMRAEKFDIVHVHWSTDYVVAPVTARRSGVPVVVMSRHSPYPLKSALGRYFYDRVLFDRVIALSDSVRKTLVDQGLRPERVTTIHHGTDVDAFRETTRTPEEIRAEWRIPPKAFVVGMVGRIAEEKGWRTFLQAIANLTSKRTVKLYASTWDRSEDADDIYAVLVGEGPEEKQAREMVRELGIGGRVVFAGFRADVNNAMNALDVHVLASTWAEPCAAVIQQAMALGKP